MGNKLERRPGQVNRKIIKHGPNKGRVDMSASPSEVKAPVGEVNVEGLLQAVREQRPSLPRKARYKGPY